MKPLLCSVLTTGTLLIASVPQQAYALSLACCTSLDEMEQHSDLIIHGRALADFDEMRELQHLSDAEYQALIVAGQPLPPGASIIGNGEGRIILQKTTLPVEVLEVLKGETDQQVLNVVQHNDWGAIPMKNGSEYLLFLHHPLPSGQIQNLYYNFYGQGTYNVDGTDQRTSSALYYDADAVEKRYGDRVQFVSSPTDRNEPVIELEEEKTRTSWFHKVLNGIRQWFKTD